MNRGELDPVAVTDQVLNFYLLCVCAVLSSSGHSVSVAFHSEQVTYLFSPEGCTAQHSAPWSFVPGICGRVTSYADEIVMLPSPVPRAPPTLAKMCPVECKHAH